MRGTLAGLLIAASLAGGNAQAADIRGSKPIAVSSEPFKFSRLSPSRSRFGKLAWRGGIELESDHRRFGGFSGLEISADGERILAVSDRGWWFQARLKYTDDLLTGLSDAGIAPIISKSGKRSRKRAARDAEALAAFDARKIDGPVLVGFERRARVEFFDLPAGGFKAPPQEVKYPKALETGPNNGELESLVRIWQGPLKGWFVAVSESNYDKDDNIRGWRWKGSTTIEFKIARLEDYRITDIALLPDAETIVTLERSFTRSNLPGLALRRFAIKDLKSVKAARGTVLFEARQPLYAFDNMEGIAVHETSDGETRLTLISDDNYNRTLQSTMLIQFSLED